MPSPPDITTDRAWLAEQQHRLLGFEILQRALHIRTDLPTPTQIRESTGITRSEPSEVYRKVFVPRLLEKLGAETVDDAIRAIRQMRDEIR